MAVDCKRRLRIFNSKRCGYEFAQVTPSIVVRCPKCEEACYDRDFDSTRESLDWYSKRKQYWYTYPEAWKEEIKMRHLENKQTVLRDKRGYKIEEFKFPE